MVFLMIVILMLAAVVVICAWPKKRKNRTTQTRPGRCPTCGSQCTWYYDADTGQRLGFRCGWCQDFNY